MRAKVVHCRGAALPTGYEADKEVEVRPEEILQLFDMGYDVLLHHIRPPHQTRREIREKGRLPDGTPVILLDSQYTRFAQK
jgi:hypothetical protein